MEMVHIAVPVIERADDGYLFRVRRPHRERGSLLSLTRHGVRAKFVIQLKVGSLIKEVHIMISQSADGRRTGFLRDPLLAH
jgi:hypothetical protein